MRRRRNYKVVALLLAWTAAPALCAPVRSGLDRIEQARQVLEGKRVGVIANQTAVDSQGRFIVDVLKDLPGVTVTALFAPEHGLWGSEPAGEDIPPTTHPVYKIPVLSLYGQTQKPTPAMLTDVDVLVFDLQDMGARFYTYIWTMALAMEASAEAGKPLVVLDRPNPLTGMRVEGPCLDPALASFMGLYPIPVVHGQTVGELARMFNGEGWLSQGIKANLTVVTMEGWSRDMWYDQTGLTFVKPSPNMPDLETAEVYPGLALLEGTNVSEGRGTALPFRQFGAPWIDPNRLAERLSALSIPGLQFQPVTFTPTTSKYQDQACQGVRLRVTDRTLLDPFYAGVRIVDQIHSMYPTHFQWDPIQFNRLCGSAAVRTAITEHQDLSVLRKTWDTQAKPFAATRQKYLLYPVGQQ